MGDGSWLAAQSARAVPPERQGSPSRQCATELMSSPDQQLIIYKKH